MWASHGFPRHSNPGALHDFGTSGQQARSWPKASIGPPQPGLGPHLLVQVCYFLRLAQTTAESRTSCFVTSCSKCDAAKVEVHLYPHFRFEQLCDVVDYPFRVRVVSTWQAVQGECCAGGQELGQKRKALPPFFGPRVADMRSADVLCIQQRLCPCGVRWVQCNNALRAA